MPPRNRVTTLVPLALALMLAACGTGPGDVAVTVTKHMAEGEIDAVMPHLSSQFMFLGEDMVRAVLQAAAAEAMAKGELGRKVKVKVVSEEIRGDVATVVLRITNENGSSREETLTMVRENKEWKVSPGDMMSK